MVSKSMFVRKGFLLQILFCLVLFFNIKFFDFADQAVSLTSLQTNDLDFTDNNPVLIPTKYSPLPNLRENAVIYKSFIAIISIMAISIIIVKCVRSIKSRGYFRKSRRLSGGGNQGDNTSQCSTERDFDGTAEDMNQRSSRNVTSISTDAKASNTDVDGAVGEYEDPMGELMERSVYNRPGYSDYEAHWWCTCTNKHLVWKHKKQSWLEWLGDRFCCRPQGYQREDEPDYYAGGPPGAPGSEPPVHNPLIQPCDSGSK